MMKRKILSFLLAIAMLLSLTAGLSGCGESGFASTKIAADKGAEIGNLKKDGWIVSVPAGTFDGDVSVTVAKASEGGDVLLTAPIDISVEGMEQVRLNQPVKITMKLDKKNLPEHHCAGPLGTDRYGDGGQL